jgi:hypothetical protein
MRKRIQSDKKNTEKLKKKRTKTNNTLHIKIENPKKFAKIKTKNK